MKIEFQFNYKRSLQAAAYLLGLKHGPMEYLILLKMLYMAERELLAKYATPLTGDTYKAMKLGPVLSHVYDLIKGDHVHSPDWENYIGKDEYYVSLKQDPGCGALSPIILTELESAFRELDGKHFMEVSDITHNFPEWKKNFLGGNGSYPIPLEDILEAKGEDEETLQAIRENEAIGRQMDEILEAHEPIAWEMSP